MTDGKELKRTFDREPVISSRIQEYHSLNGFLWQIPVVVSTRTGGLPHSANTSTSVVIESAEK